MTNLNSSLSSVIYFLIQFQLNFIYRPLVGFWFFFLLFLLFAFFFFPFLLESKLFRILDEGKD